MDNGLLDLKLRSLRTSEAKPVREKLREDLAVRSNVLLTLLRL